MTPRVRGAVCRQSTATPPETLEEFACDYGSTAVKLRSLLEIEDEQLWSYAMLSHGERKRIQIACALAAEPQVLALDEPTNHLDAPTRALVAQALSSFKGVGLLVSHDRALLDKLVRSCVFVEAGRALAIPGTYTQARRELELRQDTVRTERRQARGERASRPSEIVAPSWPLDRPPGARRVISTGTTATGGRRSSSPSIRDRTARRASFRPRWTSA